jgi:hypothetical protein
MAKIVFLVVKIPCNSITKKQTDLLNVRVNYTYSGPAQPGVLRAVVTQQALLTEFDEVSDPKEVSINLPAATTGSVNCASDINGISLAKCDPKSGYGIKVSSNLGGEPGGCLNILTITGVTTELKITSLTVS